MSMTGPEDDSAGGEEIPAYIQKRISMLKGLHDERQTKVKEYLLERAKLEAKYQALIQPLYQRRSAIISGEADYETKAAEGNGEADEQVKGIPQFWVLTLAQMDTIADQLTEDDITCLESLQDVKCEDNEAGDGFMLSFHFAENDFFDNTVLTKKYEVPNLLFGTEPMLKNVEGTEIFWKDGKCLTHKEVTQKQRGKGKNKGQMRTVAKKERQDSFFHFFTPPQMPSLDKMNEEEAIRLEAEYNSDYDIAQAFRLEIVPKAVLWYTGEGMQEMEAAIDNFDFPEGQSPEEIDDES